MWIWNTSCIRKDDELGPQSHRQQSAEVTKDHSFLTYTTQPPPEVAPNPPQARLPCFRYAPCFGYTSYLWFFSHLLIWDIRYKNEPRLGRHSYTESTLYPEGFWHRRDDDGKLPVQEDTFVSLSSNPSLPNKFLTLSLVLRGGFRMQPVKSLQGLVPNGLSMGGWGGYRLAVKTILKLRVHSHH